MYSLPIDPLRLAVIQKYGEQHKVPLISLHSAGFYSYFRMYLPASFPIVDTHPDSTATTDLRLLTPWPELSEFAADLTKDIGDLSAHEHGHIPYVVLLLHYLEKWKATHDELPPTSYSDKKAFRSLVSGEARTDSPEGGEENFEEAAAAVLKTLSVPELSSSVKEVFDYKPDEVRILVYVKLRLLTFSPRWNQNLPFGLLQMLSKSSTQITGSFLSQVRYQT
jgi:amyloid beta precursor protein binding protein 1